MAQSKMEQWFFDYSHDLYHFLVYYTGKRDVEDLVQEVYMKAMRNLHHFKGDASPKTWLISIARNLFIDLQRRQKLAQFLPEQLLWALPSHVRTPEQELELQEEVRELYDAIRQLKRSYQDVLLLRGIQELSVDETAVILGWSANRVNVTLHRAIKELKNRYALDKSQGVLSNALD